MYCSAFATLKGTGPGYPIGGFIGTSCNVLISESFSKGNIINTAKDYVHIAGFIGADIHPVGFESIIQNCYSRTGIITTNSIVVGGFIGNISNGFCNYKNCYAAPSEFSISTDLPNVVAGLFIGSYFTPLGCITNCFYSNYFSSYNGTGGIPSESLFGKSDDELRSYEMVSFPGSLGTSLNFGLDEPVWAQDVTNINDGFPVLKWQQTVGIKENRIQDNITVFPNPTTGELTIDNGQWTIKGVELFDVYGKKKLSIINCQLSIEKLEISHLASGIYFLKIETENNVVVEKIIKN